MHDDDDEYKNSMAVTCSWLLERVEIDPLGHSMVGDELCFYPVI